MVNPALTDFVATGGQQTQEENTQYVYMTLEKIDLLC